MTSGTIQEGETAYARMTVLVAGSDYFRIRIEGSSFTVTLWVPADECARFEDIGSLPPAKRNNPRHIDR